MSCATPKRIQTIEHRPSIGKLDAAAAALEPVARDSLFSTGRTAPKVSPRPELVELPHPLSAAAMRLPAYPTPSHVVDTLPPMHNPWADIPSTRSDIDVQGLARMMERPQFVIDDTGDGDGEDEGNDADLLVEVDNFLQTAGDDEVAGTTSSVGKGEPVSRHVCWSSFADPRFVASELLSRDDGTSLL